METNETDIRKSKAFKTVKTISLIIGFAYAGVASFVLLIVFLQRLMMSVVEIPSSDFTDNFNNELHTIQTIYLIFTPIIIMLGISYILFGFKLIKLKQNLFTINVALRIFSFLIPIAYSITTLIFSGQSYRFPGEPEIFRAVQYIFGVMGLLVLLAAFTVPQFIINKNIKKYIE